MAGTAGGVNTTQLPKDSAGNAIPVLAVKPAGGQKVTVTTTSARQTTAFASTTQVVSLYATEDMYVNFGAVTVTALTTTSFFLAKGIYKDFAVNDRDDLAFTHVAAIRATADGVLYVHERT